MASVYLAVSTVSSACRLPRHTAGDSARRVTIYRDCHVLPCLSPDKFPSLEGWTRPQARTGWFSVGAAICRPLYPLLRVPLVLLRVQKYQNTLLKRRSGSARAHESAHFPACIRRKNTAALSCARLQLAALYCCNEPTNSCPLYRCSTILDSAQQGRSLIVNLNSNIG